MIWRLTCFNRSTVVASCSISASGMKHSATQTYVATAATETTAVNDLLARETNLREGVSEEAGKRVKKGTKSGVKRYGGAILDGKGKTLLDPANEIATIVGKTRIDIDCSAHVIDARNFFTIGQKYPMRNTFRIIYRNTVARCCVAGVCNDVESEVAQS